MDETSYAPGRDFIRQMVARDIAEGRRDGRVVTRFPPEPNGFLHIGHAKSICLNFGVAEENPGARCHLRFDDTNPAAEDMRFVESIQRDVRWLGFDWAEHLYFASDYFEQLYEWAEKLVQSGHAYVCDLSADEMRETRGTLKTPGKESPYRSRSCEENLRLLRGMRDGEFEPGACTLRARIDMSSSVVSMRDPVLYRIQHADHYRRGEAWKIYPTYDYAHCLSDAIEGITHSLCTLEFADHRPLYDWVLQAVEIPSPPQQTEFARLNLTHTVMSKRLLRRLVEEEHVAGWDDPRMPTISGMRRRGYPPEAIRAFCDGIGVAKRDNLVALAQLEAAVRERLNLVAQRRMAVLRPLRVVIENYPEGQSEEMEAVNNPEDASAGSRKVPFSRVLYIEREDFMEDPPKKFFRLAPGREVRLRYAYFIRCESVVKDPETGEIVEIRATYDPETRGGDAPDNRKVKATLHWVSAEHAVDSEVRLYQTLFLDENPAKAVSDGEFADALNPESLEVLTGCKLEPALRGVAPETRVQFERLGYFCVDEDSTDDKPVYNRAVTLRDTWARMQKQGK